MKIGQKARVRPDSDSYGRLGEAATLVGIVGDVWTDQRGDRVSVVYEGAQVYACGWAAADFVPDLMPTDVAS